MPRIHVQNKKKFNGDDFLPFILIEPRIYVQSMKKIIDDFLQLILIEPRLASLI